MSSILTETSNDVQNVVRGVLTSMILKVDGRFRAAARTMAENDYVSLLAKTPKMSNSSTPEVVTNTTIPPSLRRINFSGCVAESTSQNYTPILQQGNGVATAEAPMPGTIHPQGTSIPPAPLQINSPHFNFDFDEPLPPNIEAPCTNKPTSTSANKARTTATYKRVSKGGNDCVMEALYEKGYDSDGELAPYMTTNNILDYEELETSCDVRVGSEPETAHNTSNMPGLRDTENNVDEDLLELMENAAIMKLKVDELRTKLAKHRLNKKGLKVELQQRLKQAMVDCVPLQREKTSKTPVQNNVFVQGAMWDL